MNDKKDYLISATILLIFIPVAYLFYWFFGLPIINRFYYIDTIQKGVFLYSLHVMLFYLFIKVLTKIQIFYFEKIIIIISYFILMYLTFFDRVELLESKINLNPFGIIDTLKEEGIFSMILNILIFVPFYTALKWLNLKMNNKGYFIIFIIFIFIIESLQYFTLRGFFDVSDIILYIGGYFIGIGIYILLFDHLLFHWC